MPRIRHSFTIAEPALRAQDMFVRDILPSLYRGTTYRLAEERPGVLVFSDGTVDLERRFDSRQVAIGAEGGPRRGTEPAPSAAPEEAPRPRLGGIIAPNVENRRPWLYVSLRRAASRRMTVTFAADGPGTRVTLAGSVPRAVRDALLRLGGPGRWPETAGEPHA